MPLTLPSPPSVTPDRCAPVADGTRREFLAALAAAGLLAGCGGDGDTGSDSDTRRFRHAMGTTEVPVSPRRIVSLHSTALTWQLATLGVPSIATAAAPADDPTVYVRLADPAAAATLDGIVSVDGGTGELDIEQIAGLRPDLIVGTDHLADTYRQLSRIAPTVLLDAELSNDRFFGTQRALAQLTGTLPELERQHERYERRVGALRERFAGRWAALEWLVLDEITGEDVVGLVNLTDDGPAHRVLTDLGAPLARSARRYADGEPYAELSLERVSGLESDVVFVAPPYTKLTADPGTPISPRIRRLLRSTSAARSGQVLTVGLAWTNANVASLHRILDDLESFVERRPGGFLAT
jgi:iron complex transport system substrate-binding protein